MHIRIVKSYSKLLTVLLGVLTLNAHAQDIIKIRNINYTSYYSKSQHIPVLVIYSLTPEQFNCNKLKGENSIKMGPDPQLPDYTDLKTDYDNSLFDQSQMMAGQENGCDKDAYTESYYFSNIMPMPKNLYKELWENLHTKEMVKAKKYKKIKVYGLGYDYYDRFVDNISGCTAQQLLDLGNKYLQQDDLLELVAGQMQ